MVSSTIGGGGGEDTSMYRNRKMKKTQLNENEEILPVGVCTFSVSELVSFMMKTFIWTTSPLLGGTTTSGTLQTDGNS